jgi:hypothetical protein
VRCAREKSSGPAKFRATAGAARPTGLLEVARLELVNTTPLPARCVAHDVAEGVRVAFLSAKATFRIAERPVLTADEALPLFEDDRPTKGGVIPGDAIGRFDRAFEVFSVGTAHAPDGVPTRAMTVSLAVGDVARSMLVVGDRPIGKAGVLPRPEPFRTMPLGWDRAFGGTHKVHVDADASIDVPHRHNALGRGFDPGPIARGLATLLNAPVGYPVVEGERTLPNVEHPDRPIRKLGDDPEPYGWSAIPRTIGLCVAVRERYEQRCPGCDPSTYRAHPDWLMDTPPAGAAVRATGLTESGVARFALPRIRVFVEAPDARVELRPQALTLLWDRGLFTVAFRRAVSLATVRPRVARLRVEDGWWTDGAAEEAA